MLAKSIHNKLGAGVVKHHRADLEMMHLRGRHGCSKIPISGNCTDGVRGANRPEKQNDAEKAGTVRGTMKARDEQGGGGGQKAMVPGV